MNYKLFFELVIVPIIAGLIAEIIKSIIDYKNGKFEWRKIIHSYGGMPSVHAAYLTALTVQVGLKTGFDSAFFAISLAFTIIILRDALGFRTYLGAHGFMLNKLISEHNLRKKKLPRLEERLGHSVPQLLVGAILGTVVVILFDLYLLIYSYF